MLLTANLRPNRTSLPFETMNPEPRTFVPALPLRATFAISGAEFQYDNRTHYVSAKLSLLEEGACVVMGPHADLFNTADMEGVKLCLDIRLVELAARYWIWCNTGEDWSPTNVAILQTLAEKQWRAGLAQIETMREHVEV